MKKLCLILAIAAIVGMGYIAYFGIGAGKTGAAENIKQGLDLAGGVSITYQVVGDENPSTEDMADTIENVERQSEIISKLQNFLLEMGKGFLFEARQKRFTFDERNFYVDLVLYNRLLQCYVLIDLKIDDLTHQDLGQMQMYVNYYDRYVIQDFEHPTIGILLCKEKSDALVELTLPEDANIYAQQYSLYLPNKSLLQQKLKEWIDEFEEKEEEKEEEA